MSNQNASRPIIVYGLPQVVDGLKASGHNVVTGSTFMETGLAAKKALDQYGSTYLVIADDSTPGLQQWADRAIAQGCRAVHVLMPGTPARLNLPTVTQLQAPLGAGDILAALGLQSAPSVGWSAPAAPAAASPSQPAQGWGAPSVEEVRNVEQAMAPAPQPAAFAPEPVARWGDTPTTSVADIPVMPTVIETPAEPEEDFFPQAAAAAPFSEPQRWEPPTGNDRGGWDAHQPEQGAPAAGRQSWETPDNNDGMQGFTGQEGFETPAANQQDWNNFEQPSQPEAWAASETSSPEAEWAQNLNEQPWEAPAAEAWAQSPQQESWAAPEAAPPAAQSWDQPAAEDTWPAPAQTVPETPSWGQPAAQDSWAAPAQTVPEVPSWGQPTQEWETQSQPQIPAEQQSWQNPADNFATAQEQSWQQPMPGPGHTQDQHWEDQASFPAAPQAQEWEQPAAQPADQQWTAQPYDAGQGLGDWNTASPSGFAAMPEPPAVPTAPVVSSMPLRSRKGQGYVAPTGPKVGKVIFVIGGKGGIGKSTMSLQIARTLANAGYKTTLVDGNVGQPDLTAYLRILNGKHNGVELPSIYQAATNGERAAVISPDVLNSVRTGFEPVKFGFVAGAPPHLNDANIVTDDVYSNVIAKCQEEMNYVVVDLQIIEPNNRSSFVENLVIPALKQGGYGMALTDMSTAGVNNLKFVLARLKDEHVEMSRIGLVLNRVENQQMPASEMVKKQYEPLDVKTVGIVSANKELSAITNSGMLELGDIEITNAVRRWCRETLGLPSSQFPDIESGSRSASESAGRASKGGFFKFLRSK